MGLAQPHDVASTPPQPHAGSSIQFIAAGGGSSPPRLVVPSPLRVRHPKRKRERDGDAGSGSQAQPPADTPLLAMLRQSLRTQLRSPARGAAIQRRNAKRAAATGSATGSRGAVVLDDQRRAACRMYVGVRF